MNLRLTLALMAVGLSLTRCSTVTQTPVATHTYKRELAMTVNGQSCVGICVINKAPSYVLHVSVDSRIDYLSFENGHRKVKAEDQGGSWDYTYVPDALEVDSPVEIVTLDKKQSKNAFGFIIPSSPVFTLPATVICDGGSMSTLGTSYCQSKNTFNEQIVFKEPVKVSPAKTCQIDDTGDGKTYNFKMPLGMCEVVFGSKNGFHRLYLIGTDDAILQAL